MQTERVLALDLSTKTGWSLQISSDEGIKLEAYGLIPKMSEPRGSYPSNYLIWAYSIFVQIAELVDDHTPTTLVIEETAGGSKNNFDQKILEWVHFLVARLVKETQIKTHYFMTEEWRRIVGCNRMSDADKKRNKAVRNYKKKNPTAKLARNEAGKVIGLIGRKHLNVRKANELYGKFLKEPLIQKDEDIADALLLGASYHLKRVEGKL